MKVVCIIQARVGSTRLKEKVLKKICGKTVLEHDINRVKMAKNIDEIIVATTTNQGDIKIVNEAARLKVKCFRGSEKDVLSRYYYAAKESAADVVVRITSDCPCIDYEIIDEMLDVFKNKNVDYMSNTLERTFPRGYDTEIFTFAALEKAFNNAKLDYEREHVTPYLYNKNNNFVMESFRGKEDYSNYRVTLDTEEDFEVIKAVYEKLYSENHYFKLNDLIRLINEDNSVFAINKDIRQKRLGE